jgi:DNA repair protein RecO (recombination protein O)
MKQIDEGILLHRRNFSESSVILDVFTCELGLQTFLFQGAKKKKNTVLQPFLPVEFEFYKRTDSTLLKMTRLSPKNASNHGLFDPIKSSISFFCSELLLKTLSPGQRDSDLYQFLQSEIQWLNETKETTNYLLWFLAKYTELLGIQPRIEGFNCTVFDFEKGELSQTIPTHISFQKGSEILHVQQAYVLSKNLFLAHQIPKDIRPLLLDLFLDYIRFHLPNMRKLESLDIIRTIF